MPLVARARIAKKWRRPRKAIFNTSLSQLLTKWPSWWPRMIQETSQRTEKVALISVANVTINYVTINFHYSPIN